MERQHHLQTPIYIGGEIVKTFLYIREIKVKHNI